MTATDKRFPRWWHRPALQIEATWSLKGGEDLVTWQSFRRWVFQVGAINQRKHRGVSVVWLSAWVRVLGLIVGIGVYLDTDQRSTVEVASEHVRLPGYPGGAEECQADGCGCGSYRDDSDDDHESAFDLVELAEELADEEGEPDDTYFEHDREDGCV